MIPMQSDSIKEIAKALIKANASFPNCVKESSGHNYKYAKLPQVLMAVLPALRANGLIIQNIPQLIDGTFLLVCQISHAESGEYIRAIYPLERDGNARGMTILQQNGCAITYAARYCIANMLSLPILNEEDNDGALLDDEIIDNKVTEKQLSMIKSLIGNDEDKKQKILEYYKVAFIDELTKADASTVIKRLKSKES